MATQNNFFSSFHLFFFVTLLTGIEVAQCSSHHHHHNQNRVGFTKLFVFGDSYADTGNQRKSANSWAMPYGITFPGKPSGRFSDGRVLTDYLASFLKLKTPIPYKWRKIGMNLLQNGMNFAHGGTGVFDTLISGPNLTTQIHSFQHLLHSGVYTKRDLASSIAMVSVAGNDYGAYNVNGSIEGLPAFMTSLVKQLALDLKIIHELGVRKVAVTGLQPLGCLPDSVMPSFKSCNETQNALVQFHNSLLQEAVGSLNNHTIDSPFIILDLYNAFMSAFKSQGDHPGSMKFENPLKPCCVGACGTVDEKGIKKYTVCEDPKSTFFWDSVHPSQQGWHAVYSLLRPSLQQLYS